MVDSIYSHDGQYESYTAAAAFTAGDFVQLDDGRVGQCVNDIANGETGTVIVSGIIKVRKTQIAINEGMVIGFDSDGNPYGGTAGTGGAVVLLALANFVLGHSVADPATGSGAAATDKWVYVNLNKFTAKYPYWAGRVYETFTGVLGGTPLAIDEEDNGKVLQTVTDNGCVTLMAVATATDLIVQNLAADGAAAVFLDPNSSDKIFGQNIGGTDNTDLCNTKLTHDQGDWVHVADGGTNGHIIMEKVGTWATV